MISFGNNIAYLLSSTFSPHHAVASDTPPTPPAQTHKTSNKMHWLTTKKDSSNKTNNNSNNKYRVYITAFTHGEHSNKPPSVSQLGSGSTAYNWGIWIEPKESKGQGRLYYVEDLNTSNLAGSNTIADRDGDGQVEPGPGPEPDESHSLAGWKLKFNILETNASTDPRFIGRIMIAKLPQGIGYTEIEELLSRIPLPNEQPDHTSNGPWAQTYAIWFERAINTLQQRGWVENLSTISGLMLMAHTRFQKWYDGGNWRGGDHKDSFV